MKVFSPGKLVLTGAYAVLEGEPAIVAAVDRYAVVDVATPDRIDTSSMRDERGNKLGLGSSAACLVAAEGAREAARGADLGDAAVRARIFRAVREAHARAQDGGSGVDVAAAVHGGVLRYSIDAGEASVRPVALPAEVVFAAFWSGASARTSELRARVASHVAGDPGAMAPLREGSRDAAAAVDAGDGEAFVAAARAFGEALARLGDAAKAPIVPPSFRELGALAAHEGAAFLPSGAGGGDVAIWLGLAQASPAFAARAEALAMRPLMLSFDRGGVRTDLRSP